MEIQKRTRPRQIVTLDPRIIKHVKARSRARGRKISREVEYLILRGLADCGDMVPGMAVDEAA